MLYGNSQLSGVENELDPDELIVTKTDLTGKITYGNRTFYKFAGFSEKECIGSQHNLIRHPEMPRTVFALLWSTLQAGEEIFAYVNNRAKNGDSYWVFAHVTPSMDSNGQIVGYHSNRRKPNRQIITDHIDPLYHQLLELEKSAGSPKVGLEAGVNAVEELLKQNKVTYNEFIFSLGF